MTTLYTLINLCTNYERLSFIVKKWKRQTKIAELKLHFCRCPIFSCSWTKMVDESLKYINMFLFGILSFVIYTIQGFVRSNRKIFISFLSFQLYYSAGSHFIYFNKKDEKKKIKHIINKNVTISGPKHDISWCFFPYNFEL